MGSPTKSTPKFKAQQDALPLQDLQRSNSTAFLSLGGLQKRSWMSSTAQSPVASPPGIPPTLKWSKTPISPPRRTSIAQSINQPAIPKAKPSSPSPTSSPTAPQVRKASPCEDKAAKGAPTDPTPYLGVEDRLPPNGSSRTADSSECAISKPEIDDCTMTGLDSNITRKRHASSAGEDGQHDPVIVVSSNIVEGQQPRMTASARIGPLSSEISQRGNQIKESLGSRPSTWSLFGSTFTEMRAGGAASFDRTMELLEQQLTHRMAARISEMERSVIERPRLELLRDACRQSDIAYLMIHQIYCAIYVGDTNARRLHLSDSQTDAFRILEIALAPNSGLSVDAAIWFAGFPGSLPEPGHYAPGDGQVHSWLESALVSVATLASNWHALSLSCRARQYPPLVGELLYRLKLHSKILQQVHFRTILRQLVDPGPRFQQHEAIFLQNQQHYSNLERRGAHSQVPGNHDHLFRNQHQQVLAYDKSRTGLNWSAQDHLNNHGAVQSPAVPSLSIPLTPALPLAVHTTRRVPSSLPQFKIMTIPSSTGTPRQHKPGRSSSAGGDQCRLMSLPSHRRHECHPGHSRYSAEAADNATFSTGSPRDSVASAGSGPPFQHVALTSNDIQGYLPPRTDLPHSSPIQHLQTGPAKRSRPTTEQCFRYIKRITFLSWALSSKSPFQKQTIEISPREMTATAEDINGRPGVPKSRLLLPGSLTHRIRCVKWGADREPPPDAQWLSANHVWPPWISIHLNHKGLEVRRKAMFGRDMPIDVTRKIRGGSNELIAVISDLSANTSDAFMIGFESIETTTKARVRESLAVLSACDAKQKVISKMGSSDPDIEVLDPEIILDLTDPFSASMFALPVRGEACAHNECFDFENFLESRVSTGQNTGEVHPPHDFRCPICKGDARPGKLVIDGFLREIRESLEESGRADVRAISIDSEGKWKIKEAEDVSGERGDGDGTRKSQTEADELWRMDVVDCDEDPGARVKCVKQKASVAESTEVIDLLDD